MILRSAPPRDEFEATCRSVARRFARLLGSAAAVFLPTQDRAFLLRAAVEDPSDDSFTMEEVFREPVTADHPVFAHAILHGSAVLSPAVDPNLNRDVAGSLAVVALQKDSELLAVVLCVRGPRARKFVAADLAMARRFGQKATDELAHAKAGRSAAMGDPVRVVRLQSLTLALNEATTAEELASAILDIGVPALGARGGAVFRMEPGGDTIDVIGARSLPDSVAVEGATISALGDHPAARVIREGDAVFLSSHDALLRAFHHLPREAIDTLAACAILALRSDGVVIGALMISLTVPAAHDTELRGLLRVIARQFARAMQRVHMHEVERRAMARLEHLARATERFAASIDLETTLANVVESFVPALADACRVEIVDHDGARRSAGTRPGRPPTISKHLEARSFDLGIIHLWCATTPNHHEDRILIDDLCRRAALAIDAARVLNEREDAIRIREDFLIVAGHELRTPLTTLRMWLFARERFGADAPVDSGAAMRQLKRIEQLVNGLLDVSRLRDKDVILERDRMELGELVREIASTFEQQVSVEAPIVYGQWDRFRLGQVITNLLANAVKFSSGKPVSLVVEDEPRMVRIRVRDEGIGIAIEEQARIFGRFERAAPSRNYGGLGLGLWISQRIVQAHGGTIRVRSQPNQGAEFIVELPRNAEAHVA